MSLTHKILMIEPIRFGFNPETAVSNVFQIKDESEEPEEIQAKALAEFKNMVTGLRSNGIEVLVHKDTETPHTPDSIFPNNWFSTHTKGEVVLYPMLTENRRVERDVSILQNFFAIQQVTDFSDFEQKNEFLEGTGSLVLDRKNKIAYACKSARTTPQALLAWEEHFSDHTIMVFDAKDSQNREIYHTNVLMCVADDLVVICLEAIKNTLERQKVVETFQANHQTILEISFAQMNAFAGNMLLLKNNTNEHLMVMSSSAYNSLTPQQKSVIENKARILHFDLSTIEKYGGGSARCMMAEIFI